MSWYHARRAVRKRIATNKRRYEEAPLRDELEAQAIRALLETKEPRKNEHDQRAATSPRP
jgi:hypothetical protein